MAVFLFTTTARSAAVLLRKSLVLIRSNSTTLLHSPVLVGGKFSYKVVPLSEK
jgi:capsule polysaccharide modification protein KpsS